MTPISILLHSIHPLLKRSCSVIVLGWLLSAVPSMNSPALAQLQKLPGAVQPDKPQIRTEATVVSPEEQRATTRRSLDEAMVEREEKVSTPSGISREEVEERLHLLDGIVTRLNSQLKLIDEREVLRKSLAAAKRSAQNWTRFSEKPPYSVLMVDEVRKRSRQGAGTGIDTETHRSAGCYATGVGKARP